MNRERKSLTFSSGSVWGLINDVLSNSPLFCGIGGPNKNSSYTGVILSIRGTSLARSRSQVNGLTQIAVSVGSVVILEKVVDVQQLHINKWTGVNKKLLVNQDYCTAKKVKPAKYWTCLEG